MNIFVIFIAPIIFGRQKKEKATKGIDLGFQKQCTTRRGKSGSRPRSPDRPSGRRDRIIEPAIAPSDKKL